MVTKPFCARRPCLRPRVKLPSLIFEYETNKAHAVEARDRILQAVDNCGVPRVTDRELPTEELLPTTGPDLAFKWRIPLTGSISEDLLHVISTTLPRGVTVRLEDP
jgi:hypothetical protein